MGLRPVGAAPHLPEVDDVADQVDDLGIRLFQKVEQGLCLRGTRAEVDIGNKEGAKLLTRIELQGHAPSRPGGFSAPNWIRVKSV